MFIPGRLICRAFASRLPFLTACVLHTGFNATFQRRLGSPWFSRAHNVATEFKEQIAIPTFPIGHEAHIVSLLNHLAEGFYGLLKEALLSLPTLQFLEESTRPIL